MTLIVPERSISSVKPRIAPRTVSRSTSASVPSADIIRNIVSANGPTRLIDPTSSGVSRPSRVKVSYAEETTMLGRRPLCSSASRKRSMVAVRIFMDRERYSLLGFGSSGAPRPWSYVPASNDSGLKAGARVGGDQHPCGVVPQEARGAQSVLESVVQLFAGRLSQLHAAVRQI